MLVTQDTLEKTLFYLETFPVLAVDTETTGLRPYHGDRLFSIIIATSKEEAFYFNFNVYPELGPVSVLGDAHLDKMKALFSMEKTWVGHNLKYDMHMLGVSGVQLAGKLHCTQVTARLVYNLHPGYSLEECAARIGFKKDPAVENYIAEHKLYEKVSVPGVKKVEKRLFYNRVPVEIIVPYGETDAKITYALYETQIKALEHLSKEGVIRPEGSKLPPLTNVYENECELLRVVYEMEQDGIKIDTDYCLRAIEHEEKRAKEAVEVFERTTGEVFLVSGELFAKVFADQKEKWKYTEKGNPCFDGDVLATFTGEAADAVKVYRDAKSRANFLHSMLYHTDTNGFLHGSFHQSGTDTGRFSSSSPNLQNLSNEEESKYFWKIRKAMVPLSRDYFIYSPDYAAQEYRLAFWYSRQMDLIDKINMGFDIHSSTAELMGLCSPDSSEDEKNKARKQAKTLNFMLLYGGGAKKLSMALGISEGEATLLRNKYFTQLPKVKYFIDIAMKTAERRGNIINWFGRILFYPDKNFSYKAPNGLIQGGCADITKIAMVRISKRLQATKSRLFISVHDEIGVYIHKDEKHLVKEIKTIMEDAFHKEPLGMLASLEGSYTNWCEKEELDV